MSARAHLATNSATAERALHSTSSVFTFANLAAPAPQLPVLWSSCTAAHTHSGPTQIGGQVCDLLVLVVTNHCASREALCW